MCALFEGLTEFCIVFRFAFLCRSAGFHVVNRAVTLLLYYCADVWRVSAHFCSEYSRTRPSAACVCPSFHDVPCLHGRSAVRAQPWLLQRLLGLFVARCALVRNSLQTQCWREKRESGPRRKLHGKALYKFTFALLHFTSRYFISSGSQLN